MLDTNNNRDELIEQYLTGTMAPKTILAFEKLIAKDVSLAKDIELFKQLSAHFNEDYISLKQDIDTTDLDTYFRSNEAKKLKKTIENIGITHTSKKKFKFPVSIAAALIGLFICVAGYLQFSKHNLYEDYYTESDLPSLVARSTTDNLSSEIVFAYQEKQFSKANNLYITYINSSSIFNENLFIYGGMTYLELNEFDKALIEFQKMTSSNSIDNSKGLWFSALVYLKKEEHILLKETLNTIVQKKNNFNHKKAVSLLQELD